MAAHGEQRRESACMQIDDMLVRRERALADRVEQARHALSGLVGIKDDAFALGDEAHGLDHAGVGPGIARPHEIAGEA